MGTAESDGVDFSLDLGVVSLSGKDLIGVQNLLKKHQALQAEIAGHEPRIKAVTQKGNAMVEEGECHQEVALFSFVVAPAECMVAGQAGLGVEDCPPYSLLTMTLTSP